jgi:hypothetical protein
MSKLQDRDKLYQRKILSPIMQIYRAQLRGTWMHTRKNKRI